MVTLRKLDLQWLSGSQPINYCWSSLQHYITHRFRARPDRPINNLYLFGKSFSRHLLREMILVYLLHELIGTNVAVYFANDRSRPKQATATSRPCSENFGFSTTLCLSFSEGTLRANPSPTRFQLVHWVNPNSQRRRYLAHNNLRHFFRWSLLVAAFHHNRPCFLWFWNHRQITSYYHFLPS